MNPDEKNRTLSSITLSPETTENLNESQIGVVKEVVYEVNNNCRMMGMMIRSTSYELVRLRETIKKDRWWTKFMDSGTVPLSRRQIQDLCKSWEFLKDSELSDKELQGVGVRTLSKLSSSSKETKKKSTKMIKTQGVFTQKDLDMIEKGIVDKDTYKELTKKNNQSKMRNQRLMLLEEQNTNLKKRNTELLNKWNLDQSSEKISQKHFQDLKKENEGLQKQVSDLEQQLDDLLKSK
jgi:hypothetical protein